MNFSVLMLADHATVERGLLYVHGGGVNAIMRTEFPSPMGVMLAAAITVPIESLDKAIDFELSMRAVDGEDSIFQIGGELVTGVKEGRERLPFGSPFVVDLRTAPVPKPGSYVLEARAGEVTQLVYFTASEVQPDDAP
ncbi:DUF6941 family protein [Nocardia asteroides]|uniref:DUF6941 family protein n=1 Tax=Nocardia asteroides TaxID=1824 RepID=UPI0033E13482